MNDSELVEMEKNTSRKLPFWYWINGPLADALTHVGQITSWRRIAGNPQLKELMYLLELATKDTNNY